MRIAFIGNFEKHKGSELFKEVVRHLGHKHQWYIFGVIKDPPVMLESIEKYLASAHRYQWGALGKMLQKNKIDVALHLGLLPETFSLTFFEVLAAEIPLIASDKGFPKYAFPEYPYFVDVDKGFQVIIESIEKMEVEGERRRLKKIICAYKESNFGEIKRKSKIKFGLIDDILSDEIG
jgi:glycosyltransferase involved in cell wall biosynthesis